jgi:hypothetical protein
MMHGLANPKNDIYNSISLANVVMVL